ncbi:MAG: diacylglycerol/polyprenol kinase family protein [Rubricoccaceae bacterium]
MSDRPPVLPYSAEVQRKALHLMAVVIPLGILLLGRTVALAVLGPMAAVALLGDWLRAREGWPRRLIHRVFAPIMRPEELPPPGPVAWNGATMMTTAAALCVLFFPASVAAAALLMQMIGDAAAALVGRRYGRTRYPGSPKSAEGSAAFFAAALVSAAPLLWWPEATPGTGLTPFALVAGALAATVTEAVRLPLNDNLRVPLTAGAAMLLAGALGP